jgi:lipopolysaccharide export system permease protein
MLALIALAALLPAPFNRRGYASRMAIAAAAALLIRILGFALANATSRDLYLAPLMYLLPLSVCGICVAIISGVRFDFLWQRARWALTNRTGSAKDEGPAP